MKAFVLGVSLMPKTNECGVDLVIPVFVGPFGADNVLKPEMFSYIGVQVKNTQSATKERQQVLRATRAHTMKVPFRFSVLWNARRGGGGGSKRRSASTVEVYSGVDFEDDPGQARHESLGRRRKRQRQQRHVEAEEEEEVEVEVEAEAEAEADVQSRERERADRGGRMPKRSRGLREAIDQEGHVVHDERWIGVICEHVSVDLFPFLCDYNSGTKFVMDENLRKLCAIDMFCPEIFDEDPGLPDLLKECIHGDMRFS